MCRKLYLTLALAAVLGLGELSSAEAQYRPRGYHSGYCPTPCPPCPPCPEVWPPEPPYQGPPHCPYGGYQRSGSGRYQQPGYGRYQQSGYGRYRQSGYGGSGYWRNVRR